MNPYRARVSGLLLLIVAALLAACGGGAEPEGPTPTNASVSAPTAAATDDPIAASVRQTVAAIAVAQTVAALTTAQPVATEQPTGDAGATSTVAPVASATTAPTQPLPTNPPPTQPPPTAVPPTAAPTATTLVIGPPPTSQNKPNGGTCIPGEDVQNIFSDIIMDPNYLFRVTAYDDRVGTHDGAGIDEVEFILFSDTGDVVFRNTESNAAYCVFQGGEPNCNTWGIDDQGRYHWGPNGSVVEAGEYFVLITLRWHEPDELSFLTECNWNSGDQPLVISYP